MTDPKALTTIMQAFDCYRAAGPNMRVAFEHCVAVALATREQTASTGVIADGDYARIAEKCGAFVQWSDGYNGPKFDAGSWGRFCDVLRGAAPVEQAGSPGQICRTCKGAGTMMGMSYGAGPDDHEVEVCCTTCDGTGEQAGSTPDETLRKAMAELAACNQELARRLRDPRALATPTKPERGDHG